jgi:hypothetical protein
MVHKKKKQAPGNTVFATIKDEKDALKEMVPALAMPNTKNTLLDELEGLKPKWDLEKTTEVWNEVVFLAK